MAEKKESEFKKGEITEERKLRIEHAKEARQEITARAITTITTALALVAALFWQTAITDTIKNFIPTSGAWQYEVIVAVMVTLFAAITIYVLSRPISKPDEKEAKTKK
jgi:hypothetical protein